uniref:Argonaute 4 family protein n=1 Tax=Rhizophora mucronata TaxID=61149 RepID=A0A2P2LXG9_RHIMU
MVLSWLEKTLLMMEKRACSLLVHFQGTNSSSLLFLKMSLLTEITEMQITMILEAHMRVTVRDYGVHIRRKRLKWKSVLLQKFQCKL